MRFGELPSTDEMPAAGGTLILDGTADPTGAIGKDGDYYLNRSTKILYGPKAGAAWPRAIKSA